ncbi:hypothetical protein EDB83DRAFT_2365561 [Lactarius deliciosus]|nr:hypothetical protein EDB83DRAFT_2365561 [Lactarius deliciosus]
MAHYDTFRDQLAIAAFGYVLWEPDPGEHNSPVEVGDINYIRQGRFHRIFNALLPANTHPMRSSVYQKAMNHFNLACKIISTVGPLAPIHSTLTG